MAIDTKSARVDETSATGVIDEEKVDRIRGIMQDDETVHALVGTFRTLGDSTRGRIIFALSNEELCVHDLAHLLEVSASAVSHQLRILRIH